ncbi:hypothetical protein [Microbispora rosea]
MRSTRRPSSVRERSRMLAGCVDVHVRLPPVAVSVTTRETRGCSDSQEDSPYASVAPSPLTASAVISVPPGGAYGSSPCEATLPSPSSVNWYSRERQPSEMVAA